MSFFNETNGTKKLRNIIDVFSENFKKETDALSTYNQFHNILRLLDVLPNFLFTTSETMGHYYLETQYVRVASRVAERLKT